MGEKITLVHSESEFKFFTEKVLQPLIPGEVFFISLSARKKYLSKMEQDFYDLGRTEMFGRTLGYGDWNYTMRKLESVLRYKRTKAGFPFPQKSMVVYININPSNMVEGSIAFSKRVIEIQSEFVTSFLNDNKPNLDTLNKADRLLMNFVQKSTGTRHYLDIDMDSVDLSDALKLQQDMTECGIITYLLSTKSGYHLMVNRLSLNDYNKKAKGKDKFMLHQEVRCLNQKAAKNGGEVIFNGNSMVPVPGTMQSYHIVRILNK